MPIFKNMFNKIQSIINRNIIDNFNDLESLVNYIKSNQRAESNAIFKARESGKGSNTYKTVKQTKIPCVIINFNHRNGYVNGKTLDAPTGYLFLDIDNENDLGNIDLNYVAAYWKSLSNKGFSIIVKVKGLKAENLKESYREVGNLLDIKYDTAAISKDRLTVLSYDSNAFYNSNSIEINLTNKSLDTKKETHYSNIKNTLHFDSHCSGSKIRYDNFDETIAKKKIKITYDENGLFDFGANAKLKFSKVIVPFTKIKKGKRTNVFSSIIHQLISLNPYYEKEQLLRLTHYINRKIFSPIFSKDEVNKLFERKYKLKNKLTPLLNTSRRFLYNPEHNLTTKEKRVLNAQKINIDKTEKSKSKIQNVLINWNYEKLGKITNKKVSEVTKMNIKTIVKYCTKLIIELNIPKIKKQEM